jgi:hypothetical protein
MLNVYKRPKMKNQLVKTKSSTWPISVLALVLVSALMLSSPLLADNTLPGQSSAYGRSLAAWQDLYWRWAYGNLIIPPDSNGNAIVGGNVVLMPLPNAPADGTPGSVDVTLNNGQSFMLPLWALLGTSYTDGTPPDPTVDVSVFRTLDITFKIDGVTVIDNDNVMNYYTGFSFDPAFPLDFPPVNAFIWFEGIGLTHTPLTRGKHTMTLDAKNTEPVFGTFIFEYHNTWNLTVQAKR